jgi:glycosyltransferase involved in cell wall biosynthesis
VSETSSSVYDAINKGIRMATGDVVGILNADDVLSDDRVIERVASAFGGSSLVHYCERSEVRESETANGEISRQDAKAQRGSERLAPLRL